MRIRSFGPLVLLCALIIPISANRVIAQSSEKPAQYTYVSEWGVPRAMWGDYSQRIPFSEQWKRLYGFRNLVYTARAGGYGSAPRAFSQFLVQALRTLLFHERRTRTLLLLAAYGLDGWRGRFRNVPPARWGELARSRRPLAVLSREAMAYESGSSQPASTPAPAPSPATPQG